MSYLYIIAHPEGWRKVGRADDPVRRFKQHQCRCSETLKGEAIFECTDPIGSERAALNALARHRIMGEWFKVDLDTAITCLEQVTGSPSIPFPEIPSPKRTSQCEPDEYLDDPESQAELLADAFETGDRVYIAHALGVVARARGMGSIAEEAGVTRAALYKALSEDGDPRLSTLLGVLKALGVQLSAKMAAE